jgi:transmembrane sensor
MTQDDPIWALLDGVRNSDAVQRARAHADRRTSEIAAARRRRPVLLGGAAAIAAAMLALVWTGAIPLVPGEPDHLRTSFGERRTVTLADGSVITLNSATELRVAMTAAERRIELVDGEAHFAVAKDATRPFRVRAGTTETEALGTQFDVARLAEQTTVTLIEGSVAVRTIPDQPSVAPVIEQLQPGQQVAINSEGRVAARRTPRLDSVLAWQRAQIEVNDATVAELLADANRYSATKIVVRDPSLLEAKISGVFRAGDTEAVVTALQRYFQLQATRSAGRVTLERS